MQKCPFSLDSVSLRKDVRMGGGLSSPLKQWSFAVFSLSLPLDVENEEPRRIPAASSQLRQEK